MSTTLNQKNRVLLVDADWHAFCQALYNGIEGKDCGRVVSGLVLPLWEEVLLALLDAWDSVCLRTISTQWNVPGRYGPYGELSFFLLKSELIPQGVGSQHSCRITESMCLDRSAHNDSGEFGAVGKWLLCVVKQFG